ncbi:DUF3347 domain-containing protein [Chryseolinea lacunae]|uniref:DUF3347 domain-containing protein n=1 Tax=Chryseolinea lacunae TaxID=2801331 RepID=A0ABS1L155_9BACT|nr:DUF3347 domain-containing protein [Chryseolinea lacunae]MBL0745253.1 DUF3347 domain-containing protein [Chryseolinea lacunae]
MNLHNTTPNMNFRNLAASLLLGGALLLSACAGKKETAEHHHEGHDTAAAKTETAAAPAGPQYAVDAAFQQQLSTVFAAYVKLKDAFVSTDAAKVKTEAAATAQALAAVDMKLVTDAAHHDWMSYLQGLEASLKQIQGTGDIEAQRRAFKSLSDVFYKAIKAYGLGGTAAFYEYCPMAFNNEGAFWLSDQEAIRNPYFGDKMLTCGEVKEKMP